MGWPSQQVPCKNLIPSLWISQAPGTEAGGPHIQICTNRSIHQEVYNSVILGGDPHFAPAKGGGAVFDFIFCLTRS